MKKHNKKLTILVSILLLTGGISLAFYIGAALINGTGAGTSGTTANINGAIVQVDGNIEFNDLSIYPGHQNVSSIKVTATGKDDLVAYNLIWNGTNSLNTSLNYYVYKSTENLEVNATCEKKTAVVDGAQHLKEECTISNINSLGTVISEGTIATSTTSTKVLLVESEFITATENGETVYYYVVLEYPNLEVSQNSDLGGSFSGTITVEANTSEPDITIAKVYIENSNGEYKESSTIPNSEAGYILNEEESTCTNNAIPTWDKENWSLQISTLTTSGTQCNLYFDVQVLAKETILENISLGTETPDFNKTSCSSGCGEATVGVYTVQDDDGTSYYFRGDVTNNYVSFAGFYWRIIRINGDGSIRLIYDGTTARANGTSSTDTQIEKSAFNSSTDDNMYVGYMYTSGEVHGLGTNSTIKGKLDSWYQSNLASYASYIDTNAGFCGERTAYTNTAGTTSGGGTGTTRTYYGAYVRLYTNKSPVLTCANSSDLYTTGSSSKGNKALIYPIGLITADEIAYAGGVYYQSDGSADNTSYYLYTGQSYWTMSPYNFNGSSAGVFSVSSYLGNSVNGASGANGVRPVINLRPDVTLMGTGTSTDPYTVS